MLQTSYLITTYFLVTISCVRALWLIEFLSNHKGNCNSATSLAQVYRVLKHGNDHAASKSVANLNCTSGRLTRSLIKFFLVGLDAWKLGRGLSRIRKCSQHGVRMSSYHLGNAAAPTDVLACFLLALPSV